MNKPPITESASFQRAAAIAQRLRDVGHEAFFVGGCVRDILRGVDPGDYDIVTSARPDEVQALFDKTVPVGARFGVVLVVEEGHSYEVATYRTEDGYEDGRHPRGVRFSTAEEDVRRRDFTVNGLLMDPQTGLIIDHVGGWRDIQDRTIRTIGEPEKRFAEDHLRLLRAIRFAANLSFGMDLPTFKAIEKQAPSIQRISAERLREEMTKLLTLGGARRGLTLLADSGLMTEVLPEVQALKGIEQPATYHPEGDVWEHVLRMAGLLPIRADECLAWAVLLHDLGKAVTRTEDERGVHFYGHVKKSEQMAGVVMKRLKFSNSQTETILNLIRYHMHFMHVRQMRPHRLKRFFRMPRFDLHLALHQLDCLGSHGMLDTYAFCQDKLSELTQEDLRPRPLLTGRDLIAMGFTPGPLFGKILKRLEDAQLNGDIVTKEEACRFIMTVKFT